MIVEIKTQNKSQDWKFPCLVKGITRKNSILIALEKSNDLYFKGMELIEENKFSSLFVIV